MIKVGIIGGSGYTSGELIRILLGHPKVFIDFVYSTTNAGKPLYVAHEDLLGETDMLFTDIINPDVDVVFLCLGHGNSKVFLENNKFSSHTKIIDLSNDFRLIDNSNFQKKNFIYGLPELNKEQIINASHIANPGCFATAIQLALLPLASKKKLTEDIHINAITGSTGAGVKPTSTTHFSWRSNNISHYRAFNHQHLGEVKQTLVQLQPSFNKEVLFIPNRGDFARGIFVTAYMKMYKEQKDVLALYQRFYKIHPFVVITNENINLKQVINTNKCIISIEKRENYLLITSILDNLTKGASGQAVQNMNLIFGLEETQGLKLKSAAF